MDGVVGKSQRTHRLLERRDVIRIESPGEPHPQNSGIALSETEALDECCELGAGDRVVGVEQRGGGAYDRDVGLKIGFDRGRQTVDFALEANAVLLPRGAIDVDADRRGCKERRQERDKRRPAVAEKVTDHGDD